MSVTEYENQFKELSRYALSEARSDEALVRKFLNGLLTKINRVVATQNYTIISQIVEDARGIEYQDERPPKEPKRAKTDGSSEDQ